MGTDFMADDSNIQLTRYSSGMNGRRYQITTEDGLCTLSPSQLLQLTVACAKAMNEEFEGIVIKGKVLTDKPVTPTRAYVRVQTENFDETRSIAFGTTVKMGDNAIVTVQGDPTP